MPNPVSFLPGHDNGVVIDLPSPPDGAAQEVAGTLTFGVGTADNDRLGTSALVRLEAAGRFTTVFGGKAFPGSHIDSGTETYALHDDGLPRCREMASAYWVEPGRVLDAVMLGRDGARVPLQFVVGDYQARRERHAGASDDVAEAANERSAAFIWGAPFFLGRRTSLVNEGKTFRALRDLWERSTPSSDRERGKSTPDSARWPCAARLHHGHQRPIPRRLAGHSIRALRASDEHFRWPTVTLSVTIG